MRKVYSEEITELIAKMCVRANVDLPQDVRCALEGARQSETGEIAIDVLDIIIENYYAANPVPICQDTGMCCVFLEIGQKVQILGNLSDAVNEGVRRGYRDGYLRKSVVSDPLERVNTGDNTPALIYTELVEGDRIKITVAPKGFGSENMSAIAMLRPSDGVEGVIDFVLDTVVRAGSNPCPPIVVGVGIGGSFDKTALLAKKALLRDIGTRNENPYYAELEQTLLERINATGIGPQGLGGRTTALGVQIEMMATHIAGLPCAVNINCHASRHVTEIV